MAYQSKRLSELPTSTNTEGLYTLGVDEENNGVKIPIGDIIAMAKTSASNAEKAATEADRAALSAQTAANNAATAKENAEKATNNATLAADKAVQATTTANNAASIATKAQETASAAAQKATEAAADANTAAQGAIAATEQLLLKLGTLIPTGLNVEPLPRLTEGNKNPIYIDARLSPEGVAQNLIFISDNRSVTVTPDGRLTIIGKGRSTIQIIPTLNTALAKVIQVEVGDPTLRLVNTRTRLRLTASGALRLN